MTATFPRDEAFARTSQTRRASVSIPANIAEGCGRGGDRELLRFRRMSLGSASQLEYQLQLARELGYIDATAYTGVRGATEEVKRMLRRLLTALPPIVHDSRLTTHDSTTHS